MTFPYRLTALYYNVIVAATLSLGFVVGSVQEINDTDETHYLRQIPQTTTCQDLDYTHPQQCHITDSESWTCLKTKALSLNMDTCPRERREVAESKDYLHACDYSEICAFADDAFSCDASYNCTIDGYGELNCTEDHINFFQKTCTPSLLYCPLDDSYDSRRKCVNNISYVDEFKGNDILLFY